MKLRTKLNKHHKRCCTELKNFVHVLFCVGVATILLGTVAFAQTATKAPETRHSAVEFAVSNSGAVWRVRSDGSLIDLVPSANGSSFPYTYDFRLLKVSPNGCYVYIGGQQFPGNSGTGKGFLEVFQLSRLGRLRLIDTPINKTSSDYPYALAFGGRGRFLYVLTAHSTSTTGFSVLSGYRVGQQGAMTRLPNLNRRFNTVPTNDARQMAQADIVSDPEGHFVYVMQPHNRSILQYHVTSNGSLETMGANLPVLPQNPLHLLFPFQGSFLYVTSAQDDSLTQLKVGANGMLRVTHFFRFGNIKHAISPIIAITPNGRFLYVRDDIHPFTKQYAIQPDGLLKCLPLLTTAFALESMTVNLTSHFLYLVETGETNERLIRPYRISSSGTLSRVKGNPTATFGNVSLVFAYSSRR